MNMKSKKIRSNIITFGLVIVFYAVMEAMLVTGNMSSLMKGLLVPLCYYMILAASLNLVVGISGELSLGHAGFMCIGAFSSAVFARMVGDSIPGGAELFISVLIGAAFAAIFGFLIGIPVLRLRGDYLAIVTLAFGEIIKNVINAVYLGVDSNGVHVSLKDVKSLGLLDDGDVIIKGAQGIGNLPRNATFTIGIVLLLITLFIITNLVNSRQGRAIMSSRDNRIAAESVGLNVSEYKLTAALVLTILPEKLRFFNDYRMLIYAIVLIVMMIMTSAPKVVAWRKMVAEKYFKKSRETEAGGKTDAKEV